MKVDGEKVRGSAAFARAAKRAAEYVKDPSRLADLVDRASRKAGARGGALAEVREGLAACLRLLRAYGRREYTRVPWQTLLLIAASVVYFVMPADLIPDFLVGLGFLDDAALMAWTLKAVRSDLREFQEWEAERAAREKGGA